MTTGQLAELLKQFKPDTPVYLAYDQDVYTLQHNIIKNIKLQNMRVIGINAKEDYYDDTFKSVDFEVADTCIIG